MLAVHAIVSMSLLMLTMISVPALVDSRTPFFNDKSDSQLQLVSIFNPGLLQLLQCCKHRETSLTAFDHLIASLRPLVFSDLASPLQTARARMKGDQQTGVDHCVSALDGVAAHFPRAIT